MPNLCNRLLHKFPAQRAQQRTLRGFCERARVWTLPYEVSGEDTIVNRSVVIIKAKEPFVQWLKSLPDPMDIALAEVNEDSSAYLLPDYEDDDEQDEVLRRFYGPIFEEQLDGWWTDERDWPRERTFAQFTRWFDIEFHSLVIDLVDAPLEDEK